MITEEQVRKAASRYRRWKLGDFPTPYKSPYFNCDGDDVAYIDRDRRTLADAYIDELSRRESERAERAKPIDAEWLESIGFDFNGLRLRRLLSIGHYELSASPHADDMLLMQDDDAIAIPHITTRGQLLDLLAALKGGAT